MGSWGSSCPLNESDIPKSTLKTIISSANKQEKEVLQIDKAIAEIKREVWVNGSFSEFTNKYLGATRQDIQSFKAAVNRGDSKKADKLRKGIKSDLKDVLRFLSKHQTDLQRSIKDSYKRVPEVIKNVRLKGKSILWDYFQMYYRGATDKYSYPTVSKALHKAFVAITGDWDAGKIK